jgi:formylmethanofuran dehydrogenase subunit B
MAALASDTAVPSVDGRQVSHDEAVAEAARRIAAARRPVVGGLGGDVQCARAALALADRLGARVVHRNQFVAQRNLLAMQSRGGITTTLAEVRNRCDCLVIVGGDPTRRFPRLLERIFVADPVMVKADGRRVILLESPPPERLPATTRVETADCGDLDLFDAVAVLRALVRGMDIPAPGGLVDLAKQMRSARYGVLVWAVADFDFTGADLLVEQLQQLTVDLNRETRWASLPLAGSEGDLSANAVSTWQTGFPLPVEFSSGRVSYDFLPDYADADALLWVGALPGVGEPRLPDASPSTTIVLGAPSLARTLPPQHVFIPVATPGIGADGHLVRSDSVITLYSRAWRRSTLPDAASVLDAIASRIEASA